MAETPPAPATPAKPSAPAAPAAPPATIDGFRSAHFGMGEAELRQAIRKDFPKEKISVAVEPSQKTTFLTFATADLLPDTGQARVSYILGYKSKQLIQVNILWLSDGRSAAGDEAVVTTANQLRDYFAAQNFAPDKVVKNQKLGEDAILVFRASDPAGHLVVLVLTGSAAAARQGKHAAAPLRLELSYIADAAHPDIFSIKKGQF